MATLIDAAEFTSNEVYQIQATDPVEGAASGASFSGTGISNQPHQQLANRTAFLKQRQDVNISNIAAMQAFQALFTGLMAQNGYLKIPIADINKGLIQYIIQWGLVNWGTPQTQGLYGPYSFPIAFPNACEVFMPVTLLEQRAQLRCRRQRNRDEQWLLPDDVAILGLQQSPWQHDRRRRARLLLGSDRILRFASGEALEHTLHCDSAGTFDQQ